MKLYETSDMCLAVSLTLSGYPVISIRPVNDKRSLFVLEDSDDLQKTVGEYHAKKLAFEPTEFFYAMRSLKARIYERRY